MEERPPLFYGSPSLTFRRTLLLAALGVAFCALGCSYGISVRRVGNTGLVSDWHECAVAADEVSVRTRETLHRLDLDSQYQQHPAYAFAQLEALAARDPQPDMLFALAEMSYVSGRQAEKREDPQACAAYYLCAGYAYHYLFDDSRSGAGATIANAFDPRFRLACDLYNTGLSKCIRAAQRSGRLDPRHELRMAGPDGKGFLLSVEHHGFPWAPEDFGPLLFASDYEVVGLTNRYRTYGLGTALIGTRVASARAMAPGSGGQPSALRYPHEVSFPVSAFFRFEGSVADLRARRAGRLELYNPLVVQTVDVGRHAVPLETDLTTPLAYFLSRTDLDGVELPGLLEGDKIQNRTGIYAFEPYQPGKIPVLMVHGLWSTPLTWTAMFNDLRADPFLREHYQFWFYLYPTGNPYLQTAADLRDTLARLRQELDPQRRDGALDQMVIVSHSLGGVVSKLLVTESGDNFWRLVTRQPFDSLRLRPQTRAQLARLFFFHPQPCVRRVVFLATPHHGSKLAPSPAGQLVAQFIRMPQELGQAVHDVAEADPQILPGLRDDAIANSVDMLAPGAPALELLASRPQPRGVHFHSIIGIISGHGDDGTDGLVTYRSAHLQGVDSEIIVPAGHSTIHQHPRSVAEVRGILMEHLREVYGVALAPKEVFAELK